MRSTRFSRLMTDLLGRSHELLVGIIGSQIEAAIDGTTLAREMVAGRLPAADARAQMSAIEHRGDCERVRLVDALSSTLTAPVDREDLFRLSRCVDDVLDSVRDFVRESHLYGLDTATQALLHEGTTAAHITLTTKKAVGRVRQCYQIELAQLFNRPLDMQTLKRRELLRRLDVAGLRLGEAADALADGIMKRGR
jgi:hypothetical protein